MTEYIHHTNNIIDRAMGPLPATGNNISGMNMSSAAELKALGWLPVTVVTPVYDSVTEIRLGPTGAAVGDVIAPNANAVTAAYSSRAKTLTELTVDVRSARAVDYRDQLGGETGDVIKTLGDVLDNLITQVEYMRVQSSAVATPEWSELLAKIVAIKIANPKP